MSYKYKNLDEPYYPIAFRDVFKWAVSDKMWGRRRAAPNRVRVPVVEPDLALIRSDTQSITWVGHATFLVRMGGRSIVIDPNWSQSLSGIIHRNVAPGLSLEDAAPDAVLITHNHRDHLDAPTIDRIVKARPECEYFVPAGMGAWMKRRGCARVVEMEWWQEQTLHGADGVTIAFVPSQHWSRRGAFDTNDSLWGGFVIRSNGKQLYHSGDTAYFSGFVEIGKRYPGIDIAMLPIGAYDPEWFMRRQHMNPDDAVRAFVDLGARLLAAMHWGTFKLTDEPLDEPPMLLEDAREREKVDLARVWRPAIGETRAI